MPTGYTSEIYDGKNVTLRDFAIRCARGMGALISMRDELLDAPLPLQLQPSTEHYDSRVAAAKARIAELEAMTSEERCAAAAKYNDEVCARNEKRVKENDALRQTYERLIAETEAWQGAPEGLKEFMLSQLNESMRFDTSSAPYTEEETSAGVWYGRQLAAAYGDIETWTKYRDEEVDRTKARNEWLAQLHASLPSA